MNDPKQQRTAGQKAVVRTALILGAVSLGLYVLFMLEAVFLR